MVEAMVLHHFGGTFDLMLYSEQPVLIVAAAPPCGPAALLHRSGSCKALNQKASSSFQINRTVVL